MGIGAEWSGYITIAAVVTGLVGVYFLTQIKESSVITWLIGLVIMGVLCASMFGTEWLK